MDDRIALEDELYELEQVHRKLDENISRNYTNYLDDSSLTKMKHERLIIKREIERVREQLGL